MPDEPPDNADERTIEFEPKGMLRRVTVPGTDIELHEPSGNDVDERAPLLADTELPDRDWTVKLLRQQAVSPESAAAVESLDGDKLLEAAQLYGQFEDLDPGADLASFRTAIISAQRARDEEMARIFATMKLPGIDASKLVGIDFDKLMPRFDIPRATLDALDATRITGEQLASMLPKVSPDLVKGLTDTSGIAKAMQEARGSFLDREVSTPITPMPALEFRDWKHEAQLDAMDRQTDLLERQGAQLAVLTDKVEEVRDQVRDSGEADRWWHRSGVIFTAIATALALGVWIGSAFSGGQAPAMPSPTPSATVSAEST
jgi:hypothetical protein